MNLLNSDYLQLNSDFYQKVTPEHFPKAKLIIVNKELFKKLFSKDVDDFSEEELSKLFSGQQLFSGSEPIATIYAGHQFGHFNPQLGDGRALLLGEAKVSEELFDVQLKGSGQTPFSRRGDGLSALGPVIREYILCEAMNKLNVPTTRALAACHSGQDVYRQNGLEDGGIFTRVASSHLRIGTFQLFHSRQQYDHVEELLNYAIKRHYPELSNIESLSQRAKSFFSAVCERQVKLVAKWMSLGFIHGVMNTDNMTISGETIDYGPCAFMDHFQLNKVYSSIDRQGRYAYSNQPKILQWNLARLADCLIPLISENTDEAVEVLNNILKNINTLFQNEFEKLMALKLGVTEIKMMISPLINELYNELENTHHDFTNFFIELEKGTYEGSFKSSWENYLKSSNIAKEDALKTMKENNPLYIPRNHLVEKAINRAYEGDYSYFHELNEILATPFKREDVKVEFTKPPTPEEEVKQTFCGT
ncbi:MAG: YdiU family protein [Oligoflexia bacterium]|nr:YdiU family protein [Oligoflexia bacterium]